MVKRIPRDYQAEAEKMVRNGGQGKRRGGKQYGGAHEFGEGQYAPGELREQDDFGDYDDEEEINGGDIAQHWQR